MIIIKTGEFYLPARAEIARDFYSVDYNVFFFSLDTLTSMIMSVTMRSLGAL